LADDLALDFGQTLKFIFDAVPLFGRHACSSS